MALALRKTFSPGQVSTGPGTPRRDSKPTGPGEGQATDRGGRTGSPFTFSAGIRPPRSRRGTAMAQTQLAEVAPRFVTCARTRTTRGSALRSRSPIAGQGGHRRLSAHFRRTPLKEFTNPGWERAGSAPEQAAGNPDPQSRACPPCPDLSLNSAACQSWTTGVMLLAFLFRLESLLCLLRFCFVF